MNTSLAVPTAPSADENIVSNPNESIVVATSPVQHTDRPLLNTAPDLDAREQALLQELDALKSAREQRAAEVKVEQEAATKAKQEALISRVKGLPAELGLSDLPALVSVIRSVQAGGSQRPSPFHHKRGTPLSEDVKELLRLAFQANATISECAARFKIASGTVSTYKKKMGLANKGLGGKHGRKPAKTAKQAIRRGKGKVKLNSRGRKLVIVAPYSPEMKASAVKALGLGATVPSLHRLTGISPASLSIYKRVAGFAGKKIGGIDVQELIDAGKVKFPKAA